MTKILFVCHGNICRSTMAQFVMQHMVEQRGLAGRFFVDSAATSAEELGNPPHPGTRRKLAAEGVPCGQHFARRLTREDYQSFDLLIGMDSANMRNMQRLLGGDAQHKLHLLLDYTARPGDIADPWYSGDFDATYHDVCAGCEGLLAHLTNV